MLRAPYRGPIKFYMSISNRPITITRGDNLKSISFSPQSIINISITQYIPGCIYKLIAIPTGTSLSWFPRIQSSKISHTENKVNVEPRYNKLLQPYRMDARPISVSLATPSFIDISGYNIFYRV